MPLMRSVALNDGQARDQPNRGRSFLSAFCLGLPRSPDKRIFEAGDRKFSAGGLLSVEVITTNDLYLRRVFEGDWCRRRVTDATASYSATQGLGLGHIDEATNLSVEGAVEAIQDTSRRKKCAWSHGVW